MACTKTWVQVQFVIRQQYVYIYLIMISFTHSRDSFEEMFRDLCA